MKRILMFVSICIFSGIFLIAFLYAFRVRPYDGMNGFNRTDSVERTLLVKSVDLKYVSYYFAGVTNDSIYLGNYQGTGGMLITDFSMDTISRVNFKFDKPEVHAWDKARLTVDSPFIYLKEGISPVVYMGRLDDLQMSKTFMKASYFSTSLNISTNGMIVKSVSAKTRTNILVKVTNDSPYEFRNSNILTKQIDGIFCTEGSLAYDKENNVVVYTYYYRNEFIKLDTNLNVLMRSHTIDTNTIAKISIAEVSSGEIIKFSAPPKYVNLLTAVDKNKLYVISALIGDNELREERKMNTIIDKYSLQTGKYLGTIYVPRFKQMGITDFIVTGDKLYAIYGHNLCLYKI